MSNFEGIQLTREEERLFTDILLNLTEQDSHLPVSNADLLHELCKRAESYSKIKALNVNLRKSIMCVKKEIESGEKRKQEKGLLALNLLSCVADIFDTRTALLYQKAKAATKTEMQTDLFSEYEQLGSVEEIKNALNFVSDIQQALQHSHSEDRDLAVFDAFCEYRHKQDEIKKNICVKLPDTTTTEQLDKIRETTEAVEERD